jgi:hypothetical protein
MKLRLLICGDRDWCNYEVMNSAFTFFEDQIDCVIEGEASGADSMGRFIAEERGIVVEKYPANWKVYHKAAGPIRNKQMLEEGRPNLVLAFHDDISSSVGTKDMIRQALASKVPVVLYTSNSQPCFYTDKKDFSYK